MPADEPGTEIKTAAQLLAAQRRRVELVCAVCGQRVEGTTKRRYCSNACRQRAKHARQRQQQAPS